MGLWFPTSQGRLTVPIRTQSTEVGSNLLVRQHSVQRGRENIRTCALKGLSLQTSHLRKMVAVPAKRVTCLSSEDWNQWSFAKIVVSKELMGTCFGLYHVRNVFCAGTVVANIMHFWHCLTWSLSMLNCARKSFISIAPRSELVMHD